MKQRLRLIQRLIDGTATEEEKVVGISIPVVRNAYEQSIKKPKVSTIKTRRKSNG